MKFLILIALTILNYSVLGQVKDVSVPLVALPLPPLPPLPPVLPIPPLDEEIGLKLSKLEKKYEPAVLLVETDGEKK